MSNQTNSAIDYAVDYVITYVDNTDNQWLKSIKKVKPDYEPCRYRSNNSLLYNLRLLEQNVPWIRKVWLVVASESQVPAWINRDNVNVVLHKDFIPATYLPTFNSCTIEMFLPFIKGLSKYFIYANDDTFMWKPVDKSVFFDDKKMKLYAYKRPAKFATDMFGTVVLNAQTVLNTKYNKKYFYCPRHFQQIWNRDVCQKLFNDNIETILKSISQFRKKTNLNQYFYTLGQLYLGKSKVVNGDGVLQYVVVNSNNNYKKLTGTLVCINDIKTTTEADIIDFNTQLKSIIPNQSTLYEKQICVVIPKKPTRIISEQDIPIPARATKCPNLSATSRLSVSQAEIDKTIDFLKLRENTAPGGQIGSIDFPVDYVFPYVTMNDPDWMRQYMIAKGGNMDESWECGAERYTDNGALRLKFRCLEQNMPWLNKVWLIVMQESQVPEWINRDNVNIIYHKDFIPAAYLPVFSSAAIEMFLPFLPCSDNFIYGNDDMFVINPTEKSFFFSQNKLNYCVRPVCNSTDKNISPGYTIRKNACNLLELTFDSQYNVLGTQHVLIPYNKLLLQEAFNTYMLPLTNSVSKFRTDYSQSQYFYAFYQYVNGYVNPDIQNVKNITCKNTNVNKILTYNIICMNDGASGAKPEVFAQVSKQLYIKYPKKSKYEL